MPLLTWVHYCSIFNEKLWLSTVYNNQHKCSPSYLLGSFQNFIKIPVTHKLCYMRNNVLSYIFESLIHTSFHFNYWQPAFWYMDCTKYIIRVSDLTWRYGCFLWIDKLVICNVLPRKKPAMKRSVCHSRANISSATIPNKQQETCTTKKKTK